MDSVLLGDPDLASRIETISFEEGPPLFMQEYEPSFDLSDRRIDVGTLNEVYYVLKFNSVGGDLIDQQTFITLMMLELQQGKLSALWRTVEMEKIIGLSTTFSQKPLSDDVNDDASPLFRDKNSSKRRFVNWKLVFLAMALNANRYPEVKDLKAYIL